MSFSIRFKDVDEERVFDDAIGGSEGWIKIGDLAESFFSVTAVWTEDDYEKSWDDNLAALREGNDAYFLTDVSGGDEAGRFFVWPAFHLDGTVHFTQKLLLRSNAEGHFGLDSVVEMIDFDGLRSKVGGVVSFFPISPDDLPPFR